MLVDAFGAAYFIPFSHIACRRRSSILLHASGSRAEASTASRTKYTKA